MTNNVFLTNLTMQNNPAYSLINKQTNTGTSSVNNTTYNSVFGQAKKGEFTSTGYYNPFGAGDTQSFSAYSQKKSKVMDFRTDVPKTAPRPYPSQRPVYKYGFFNNSNYFGKNVKTNNNVNVNYNNYNINIFNNYC